MSCRISLSYQMEAGHDAVGDDPCHLAWQVSEILWLDSLPSTAIRPLPARPAGERDSDADDLQDAAKSLTLSTVAEPDFRLRRTTQGGRGLVARKCGSSHEIFFTCRMSRQGSRDNLCRVPKMPPTAFFSCDPTSKCVLWTIDGACD
jgi:hypothetical protein